MSTSPDSPSTQSLFGQLYPFRHARSGSILLNRNDVYVRGAIQEYGEFSEAEVDLFREVLAPDDLVVEVGANMGAHTLALAGLVNRVYAFEPQRFMFQMLCGNLALNSVDNVVARQCAIGAVDGTIRVPCLDPHVVQNFGSFGFHEAYDSGDFVQCITLDSLVFPRLDFLKLDCEGSELQVLEGAATTIAQHRPWIYVEFAENRAAILALLTKYGYFFARHVPPINREPNFAGKALSFSLGGETNDGALASDMVLACPAEREPRPLMRTQFGQRHGFFLAKDEDVMSQSDVMIEWVGLYGG